MAGVFLKFADDTEFTFVEYADKNAAQVRAHLATD
jgi:hypothetical protein